MTVRNCGNFEHAWFRAWWPCLIPGLLNMPNSGIFEHAHYRILCHALAEFHDFWIGLIPGFLNMPNSGIFEHASFRDFWACSLQNLVKWPCPIPGFLIMPNSQMVEHAWFRDLWTCLIQPVWTCSLPNLVTQISMGTSRPIQIECPSDLLETNTTWPASHHDADSVGKVSTGFTAPTPDRRPLEPFGRVYYTASITLWRWPCSKLFPWVHRIRSRSIALRTHWKKYYTASITSWRWSCRKTFPWVRGFPPDRRPSEPFGRLYYTVRITMWRWSCSWIFSKEYISPSQPQMSAPKLAVHVCICLAETVWA